MVAKPKHTPGPWRLGYVDHTGATIRTGDAAQLAIATATGARPELEANARLIAVAPELLEAAELALKQMEALAPQLSTASYLRAAIAKAMGES